jgi:hypothetical protein
VLIRQRGGARPGGDGLQTQVVGSGKSGGGFGPAMSARTRAIDAFMAWARGSAALAKQRVAQHVVLGGDRALTRGPRHGKEETDWWDPTVEIFLK